PGAHGAAIRKWIVDHATSEALDDAWQSAARHWLSRLCHRLGRSHNVAESEHFHLLSELDSRERATLLSFLEEVRSQICRVLGDVAWTKAHGKHVVLRFSESDDYYRYVSFF